MLQQALGSGYLNSVISTIEMRYEIPSSTSGVLASTYGVGNVATILFVSYLGSQRHIPVFIGFGVLLMGISSLLFALPHFITSPNAHPTDEGQILVSEKIICQKGGLEIGFSSLDDSLVRRSETCLHQTAPTLPVFFFTLSQLLLGIGGSPLLTLGTAYIDNHVDKYVLRKIWSVTIQLHIDPFPLEMQRPSASVWSTAWLLLALCLAFSLERSSSSSMLTPSLSTPLLSTLNLVNGLECGGAVSL